VSVDPVLQSEQAHLIRAEVCVQQMREAADGIADYGVDALASESLGRMRAERIEHLAGGGDAPSFFGRTDRLDGEVFHLGRRHVRDGSGDPVVIDWRAPIARPFYQATPADPQGVRLRRRFGFAPPGTPLPATATAAQPDRVLQAVRVLTSYEDERLDAGENLGLDSALLREEIERPRVGPMRDIVATIQPDQDELVRADLDTSLCIQGAPGTGKTAVGLHRAAYLLYSYPERLRRSGVLVVGPNAAFLRYIAQVLPALGESGITQTTADELVMPPGRVVPAMRPEPVEIATLKGDARLAEVLRRAVFSHIAKPAEDVVCIVGTKRYRIQVERLRRYVDDARRSMLAGELRWDSARERLRMLLAQDVRRQRENSGGAPSDTETRQVARSAPVKEFIDASWPALDPREVLVRLFTDPAFLRRCGGTVLDETELALLAWDARPRTARTAPLSAADRVLLDELRGLIAGQEQYVHVVVDEAQDLSAMQCRAVARRCPIGSVTVLGDLAQATTPWAPGSWPDTLAHLGRPGAEVRPLTIGYRVPGEVLAVANRLLPHIAPEVPPATSVRAGGDALTYTGSLVEAVRRCLAVEGSIAVIAADAATGAVRSQLAAAGIMTGTLDDDFGGDQPPPVTVVAASAAKGLEYDSVVIVEPAAIVAGEPTRLGGLRRLYVAWTRAVSRLAVVHTDALPAELG
jgi:DNA helicase IV